MSLVTMEQLKAEAQSLGLESNKEILEYCTQQQRIHREERQRIREMEKENAERAEREAVRAHELALAQLTPASAPTDFQPHADRTKLPLYKDNEDITNYLIRFERIADLLGLKEESFAVRLGTLLTGKAVDIYASFSPEVTADYKLLKAALLAGFRKTPDGYRTDFKTARVGPNETHEQFVTQLSRKLEFWINSLAVGDTRKDLYNFILKDQFLSSVGSELRTFLKEQGNDTPLDKLAIMADNWTMAHGQSRSKFRSQNKNNKEVRKPNSDAGVTSTTPSLDKVKCYSCGALGHYKNKCPKNPSLKGGASAFAVQFNFEDVQPREFMSCGSVNGSRVSTICRDTGCSRVLVSEDVLPDVDTNSCEQVTIYDYLGRPNTFPVVKCYLACDFYDGFVDAIRAPLKFCSVLVGNVPGVQALEKRQSTPAPDVTSAKATTKDSTENAMAVTTRSSSRVKSIHPLIVPKIEPTNLTPTEFAERQKACESLSTIRQKAESSDTVQSRDGSIYKFIWKDNLLYRSCTSSQVSNRVGKTSLVVPIECRRIILELAHDAPLAGHFSHRKTEWRVTENFYWPGMGTDIRQFCRSCDKCQRLAPKGRTKPVPMVKMPIFTEPFARVSIDIIGPINPSSYDGHRYALTLIDFATGFPEAVPLKDIDSISVAEALLQIFSRVGIPREILSDRGPQFTSLLMAELHKLLGVKPLFSSPYHPQGNGRVEKLHVTLKAVLRKLCSDRPRDWHRYLAPTLFALREIPSDRSGFSAFELLYGKQVRGPLAVLRDLWEDSDLPDEERPTFQYIFDLRDRLEHVSELASMNSEVSANKYKAYFDLKSQDRSFVAGDEVLILLPDSKKKLLMSWSGPHKILERKTKVDYLVDHNGSSRLYHINLLKRYYRRAVANQVSICDESDVDNSTIGEALSVVQSCIIESDLEDSPETPQIFCESTNTEQTIGPEICPTLSKEQVADVENLLTNYSDVMSEKPGLTNTLTHDVQLITTAPVRTKVYPVPVHLRSEFEKEVDKLLELGIIHPSTSAYCSPVVLVKKADGSYRLTVDYRHLNALTVFDAEPACNMEDDLHCFTGSVYFTELDLTKAYHQIPLTERARKLSAFPTHLGLMEFSSLPFGMVTACATYIRLMRIVLRGLPNVSFYFDNIFIYSSDWSTHLTAIKSVLDRLRLHGLTARPCKCRFGFSSLQYLGFVITGETIAPQHNKVEAIAQLPFPKTKKTLQSFLGMVSFYRRFIPNVATMTAPLSDLLRKGVKEPFHVTETLQSVFHQIKDCLTTAPILHLPNTQLPFVVRTDASALGIASVLLQYYDDTPFPVAYASRKLLDRERNYSTIERECLAIVFGIHKFKFYLIGKEFVLEVDHRPLLYLNSTKGSNSRLMRWAIGLQPFRFRTVHISGVDNVGADLLSRAGS